MAIKTGLIGFIDIGHAPVPYLLDDAIASNVLSSQPLHFPALRFLPQLLAGFFSECLQHPIAVNTCPATSVQVPHQNQQE